MANKIVPHFQTSLVAEEIMPDLWKLREPLRYQSVVKEGIIEVPAGFVTDFDSTPRFFPLIYAMIKGKFDRAAVIHDYIYQCQLTSKEDADKILLEAMRICGLNFILRRIVYWGVRLGGKESYDTGPERMLENQRVWNK